MKYFFAIAGIVYLIETLICFLKTGVFNYGMFAVSLACQAIYRIQILEEKNTIKK
jgi:hypothetical protein